MQRLNLVDFARRALGRNPQALQESSAEPFVPKELLDAFGIASRAQLQVGHAKLIDGALIHA